MRVVVTGAGGLLGKKLVNVFRDHEVIGVYNTSKPETEKFLILDLTRLEEIEKIEDFSPDVIIHAAALTDVDGCERNPALAKLINVEATKRIASLAERNGIYLVYVSTDYVFDGRRGNYSEEDEPNPISVYGATKLEGERVVREVSGSLVVRTSTPYGSNPASGKDNFALWLLKRLRGRQEVKIIVDQITSPTLNTSFAMMLRESVERRLSGILHLTDASQLSRYDFSIMLARTFGLDEGLIKRGYSHEMNWIARRPLNSSLNVAKASSLLEHRPLNIERSLEILRTEMESEGHAI
ncbi:hypothetical protein L3N51_02423 [Metallosphaera sp. J1]|uniref:dTDP-4-dehydrorhamnose reductase n=1 Tax=Metallosphaera javensis (ex Hofmann et al. 2022) TaxID=99938 RepID=UPI001EDFE873|nr:dTDP-4-dehydrorhamnose reductase [Metallosphaera javensis (ex Hofmann et al. 2022)]MCG3110126.1 hypothetical protein [Metallosphaera javensis (ex Hofmann et al. 2022)]